MKNAALLLLLLAAQLTYAQKRDSAYRYHIACSYVLGIPEGQFSSRGNNQFLRWPCKPSSGFNIMMTHKLKGRFDIGLNFSIVSYIIDHNSLYNQLRSHYSEANYYTTVQAYQPNYSICSFSLTGSYKFIFRFAEVAPYAQLGVGFGTGLLYYPYTIHRKEMNSNYSEDINTSVDAGKAFFFPGIGVNINKKLYKIFYATVGIQYNYGVATYTLTDMKTDYLNNFSSANHTYSQPVSTLQAKAGVEWRFRKKYRHKRE